MLFGQLLSRLQPRVASNPPGALQGSAPRTGPPAARRKAAPGAHNDLTRRAPSWRAKQHVGPRLSPKMKQRTRDVLVVRHPLLYFNSCNTHLRHPEGSRAHAMAAELFKTFRTCNGASIRKQIEMEEARRLRITSDENLGRKRKRALRQFCSCGPGPVQERKPELRRAN